MAFVNVSGTVTRTFYQGKGAEVTESFEVKGKEVKKRWTAWFDTEHGLSEGDVVEVSGLHGDEVSEWTDKEDQVRHTVKRSLNKAKLKGEPQGSHVPVQEQKVVNAAFASPGTFNDETPF